MGKKKVCQAWQKKKLPRQQSCKSISAVFLKEVLISFIVIINAEGRTPAQFKKKKMTVYREFKDVTTL